MKILAVEFSGRARCAAIADAGPPPRELAAVRDPREREARPLALVETALQQAGLEREDIDVIAVGLGPGSYAGIRGAISLAQGWQLARAVRLIGLSSADVAIAQAHAAGHRGRVQLVVDTHRRDFHTATYELDEVGWRVVAPFRPGWPAPDLPALHLGSGPGEPGQMFIEAAAATLARLAAGRSDFAEGADLAPIYLRETSFVKAAPPRADLGSPPRGE